MALDYNLVVIGSTPEGIYAALTAAHLKARVALVEQPLVGQLGAAEATFSRTFSHLTRLAGQVARATQVGIYGQIPSLELQLPPLQAWAAEVNAILVEQQSPAILSALGVDFISGAGEFRRLPQLEFIIGKRRLRSRAYLLAAGCYALPPQIAGLAEVGYLTPTDFCQSDSLASLPQQLAVVGESPIGVELAQNLNRLGKEVTLIAESDQILATEEIEAVRLIQAQLEAEGVRLLVGNPIRQVRQIEAKKWLQIGEWAIAADEIILAGQHSPNLEGLNLEGIGVKWGEKGLQLNSKLQTSNPRVYGCGSVAGGYPFSHLAQYEARIAVKNALFWPWLTINYSSIPYGIFTEPPLARVGMTEAQARKRYGEKISTIQHYYKTVAQAQILGETAGFCKLVVRRNGEILGAHLVGAEAGELIGAIALAIQHKIKVREVADLSFPDFTLSEIVRQTALAWQRRRDQQNNILQSFLEHFLRWMRKI